MNVFRLLKWLAGIAASLVLLALVLLAFMDWNLLRAPIGRWVSDSTGRSFAINGDLDVHLGLRPRLIVNDLVLGNAAWSDKPNMLEIKRLDFSLDIFRLLTNGLAFSEIALSAPQVILEVSRDGMPNWVFNDQKANQAVAIPDIDNLTIDHGSATYSDPRSKTELLFELKTRAGDQNNPSPGLEIIGKGRFKGLPTTLNARGGALLSLRSAENPYPIKASGVLGNTRVSIEGNLLDPLNFKGPATQLHPGRQ
jgi:uncharacterized protein involved in outer membrane biogenesis